MLKKAMILAAMLCGLAACAAPTAYQPADGRYGYAQQQIEGNRFRVSFTGNSLTSRQTVENYLLYRAAELTLINGGDHFVVVDRDIEINSRNAPGFGGFSGFHGSVDRWGNWRPHPHGLFFYDTGPPITEYRAYANIVVYRGPKPADDPDSYDARDVMVRLGPVIKRPVPH